MTYTAEEVNDAIESLNEAFWDEDVEVPELLAEDIEKTEDPEYGYKVEDYWTHFGESEELLPIVLDGERVKPELVVIEQDPLDYTYYYAVFKIGDQYFRKNGWYQSHYGSELDGDIEEVEKVTVQVNQWKGLTARS